MKLQKRFIIPLIIILIMVNPVTVFADENVPYDTYNYDYWENIYYTPAAYLPGDSYSGIDVGTTAWNNPQDFYVAEDGRIYVADTGNNRIVVLDKDMKLDHTIEGFTNNGVQDTFDAPSGVCVTSKNEVYIADTNHLRIVVLDEQGTLLKTISNPKSEVLEEGFVFTPLRVITDYADRVYVIAKNMFQGIMAFDSNGEFTGFSGTIKVQITPYEKLWRRLSTKAQRSRQSQFIPTEFTGLDIDPDGFLYATNIDSAGEQSIRRLNP
ncbi:MAG TPA: gluconolactonase, partial [Lachnospiraceae bacterium]|nr:gluconolactonase [Lachnospiraceae bacterium]